MHELQVTRIYVNDEQMSEPGFDARLTELFQKLRVVDHRAARSGHHGVTGFQLFHLVPFDSVYPPGDPA